MAESDTEVMTAERAAELLEPLSQMLRTDGYELTVLSDGLAVEVSIRALPGACEDCLIPQTLMTQIARDALMKGDPASTDRPLLVRYPTEIAAH